MALKYLAENDIVHRDLKPQNLILASKSSDYDVKIADFGLAINMKSESENRYLKCGTPGFIAPEILKDQKYDSKADVFSAGVIMHVMLTGKHLFHGSVDTIIEKNKYCKIDYELTDKLSPLSRDLLRLMLEQDPEKRFSAAQAIEHAWFTTDNENVIQVQSIEEPPVAKPKPGGQNQLITATPVMAGRKIEFSDQSSPLCCVTDSPP